MVDASTVDPWLNASTAEASTVDGDVGGWQVALTTKTTASEFVSLLHETVCQSTPSISCIWFGTPLRVIPRHSPTRGVSGWSESKTRTVTSSSNGMTTTVVTGATPAAWHTAHPGVHIGFKGRPRCRLITVETVKILAAFVVLTAAAAVVLIVEMSRRRQPLLGLASLATGTVSGTAASVYGLLDSL
jgi:hypothetical protein